VGERTDSQRFQAARIGDREGAVQHPVPVERRTCRAITAVCFHDFDPKP
jgi:hypothetical protein